MSKEKAGPPREHPRFDAVFKIAYQEARSLADYTENLSEGGVFIATDLPLEPGASISFEISFPGLVKPIRLSGQVIWRRVRSSLAAEEAQGVGVRFQFGSEVERQWLRDLLQRFAAGQAEPDCQEREFLVLLAEDNQQFSRLISEALAGFRVPGRSCLKVVQVENAEDAKRTLEQEAVDLVIAEWRLCRQAGLELLEIARRRAEAVQRRIPVIVLGSDQDEHQAGLEAGADVFLRRPFPARGLLATLQALLLPTA